MNFFFSHLHVLKSKSIHTCTCELGQGRFSHIGDDMGVLVVNGESLK